jgi:serine/threonine-protein kinase
MTETGMSLGTPHYMSPEQAMGEREITARSDVYALGCVLYEMLTGDPPFTGSTAQAVVARVVTESPRPMLPQRHTIPPHVEAAVLTALEKLPADRFASAAEFVDALKDKNYASTVSLETAGAARVRPGQRRQPGAVVLMLGAALAVATAAALWGRLRPAPAPLLSQFSLSLRPNQGLQPPLGTCGARIGWRAP